MLLAAMQIPGVGSNSTPRIQTIWPSNSSTGQTARLEPVILSRSSTSLTLRAPEE
jgi:hypothetical protein